MEFDNDLCSAFSISFQERNSLVKKISFDDSIELLPNDSFLSLEKREKRSCPTCFNVSGTILQFIPCGHRTCESCFNELKEPLCPLCKEYIQSRFADVAFKREKVMQLEVHCQNSPCLWIGKLSEFKRHLEGSDSQLTPPCDYELIDCSLCSQPIMRGELVYHMRRECQRRLEQCQFCQKEYIIEEEVAHWDDCVDYPTFCKFEPEGCDIVLPLKEVRGHESHCKFSPSICVYNKVGCSSQFLRKQDLAHHSTNEAVDHLEKFFHYSEDKFKVLESDISNLAMLDQQKEQDLVKLEVDFKTFAEESRNKSKQFEKEISKLSSAINVINLQKEREISELRKKYLDVKESFTQSATARHVQELDDDFKSLTSKYEKMSTTIEKLFVCCTLDTNSSLYSFMRKEGIQLEKNEDYFFKNITKLSEENWFTFVEDAFIRIEIMYLSPTDAAVSVSLMNEDKFEIPQVVIRCEENGKNGENGENGEDDESEVCESITWTCRFGEEVKTHLLIFSTKDDDLNWDFQGSEKRFLRNSTLKFNASFIVNV